MNFNEINKQIAELDDQINAIKEKMAKRIDAIKVKQEKLLQKKNEYLLKSFKSAGLESLSHDQLQQLLQQIAKENI